MMRILKIASSQVLHLLLSLQVLRFSCQGAQDSVSGCAEVTKWSLLSPVHSYGSSNPIISFLDIFFPRGAVDSPVIPPSGLSNTLQAVLILLSHNFTAPPVHTQQEVPCFNRFLAFYVLPQKPFAPEQKTFLRRLAKLLSCLLPA